jgi:hypothetical protein
LIHLPSNVAAGSYDLQVGLYDLTTGRRLPTASGSDQVNVATIDVKAK